MKDIPVNLSEPSEKSRLINAIRATRGKVRVTILRWHPRRTDRQNRYYWPCFVHALWEYLHEQGSDLSEEAVHQLMRAKFLTVDVADPATGEVIGQRVRSTTELSTVEFNDYLDRCAEWLRDMFGVRVPDANTYREREETRTAKAGRNDRETAA